tara:strand:+ start:560 stop:700 length:141 start_codon:yes stop_codon:yes gene_type:complete
MFRVYCCNFILEVTKVINTDGLVLKIVANGTVYQAYQKINYSNFKE